MKLKKLVAGMAAAGGGLMLLTTVLFKDEIHDWLFAIRRVRTWGDLLAQKPIRLSDGVIVRLGIEDTRCPQGSGVLLYCLTEGYDPGLSRIGSNFTEGGLGPLEVSVLEEGAVFEEQKAEILLESLGKKTTARLLFARAIPVPRSGRYHLTVSEHGKALRHVRVKGTDESIHPWLTLTSRSSVQGRGLFICNLAPCWGSSVLPGWCGFLPCAEVDPSNMDPALPLPRLFPDSGTYDLELRQEANSLVMSSRSGIAFSRRNFAARWWVNGHAVPEASKESSFRAGESLNQVQQLRLKLDFDSAPGELRSGDRVSLQILYSDQGWILTDGGEGLFSLSDQHRILQSNRIELTVP